MAYGHRLVPVAAVTVLHARELYRFYRVDDEETMALRGVSLTVPAGRLLTVVGPSGSGKSTLLACLSGPGCTIALLTLRKRRKDYNAYLHSTSLESERT